MKRVIVIGASLSGSLAACYLKMRFPDFDVITIQKQKSKIPIVGESLTEFSTLMLHEIGLGSYLEEQHFHKYGLTFYFKEKIDDPSDFRYATHEAMRIPPMPSNQVNRFALDRRLKERAKELNVRAVEGTAKDAIINCGGLNQIVYSDNDGESITLDTDWIVDASGRSRFLTKELGLKKAPEFQRSSFWFRLQGFDKAILKQMIEIKSPHCCFDSYYVTHHFFGRNNWIWAIPIRAQSGAKGDLISIGIVYRPDLYEGDVRSIDDFISHVEGEHPVIANLVRSGRIVDTNTYQNYFYETEKSYSEQGWFVIGDAGDTVDPLYSTGIVMTAIQIKQVAAIIDADARGALKREFVDDLESLYKLIRGSLQSEISTLYEVMHDPFQSHMRMHFASAFYFYFLLPAWLNGYITDPVGSRIMIKILNDGSVGFDSLKSLLPIASKRLGSLPAAEIHNQYDKTVNWELFGPSEKMLPPYLAKFCLFYARTRFELLRKSGWHEWRKHLWMSLADVLKAVLFGVVIGRRSLKNLTWAKRMVRRPSGGVQSTTPSPVSSRVSETNTVKTTVHSSTSTGA